ncbi:MAG: adenylate/guanylate cyclase domain-containing protein [Elusimicrobiota bacterium]
MIAKNVYQDIVTFIPKHLVEIFHSKRYKYEFAPNYLNYTMLYIDITGFTALSEKLATIGNEGAEKLVIILNFYFRNIIKIIDENKGYIIKFGGDAILSMFPVIKGDISSSVRACFVAAGEIGVFFKNNPTVRTPLGTVEFNVTMSINNGQVFSSVIGSKNHRLEYFISGKMLNELALAELVCPKGEIIACERMKNLLIENRVNYRRINRCESIFYITKPENIDLKNSPLVTKIKRIKLSYKNLQLQSFVEKFLDPVILKWIKKGYTTELTFCEHKRCSSVFVNFIGLEEIKDVEKTNIIINQYFNKLLQICLKYNGTFNGTFISTEGISFLVIFGVPESQEKQELLAIDFAIELRDYFINFNKENKLRFAQKIGINTGNVFCGIIGSHLRKNYTIMGDAVNCAYRFMSKAKDNSMFVGEETIKYLRNCFLFTRYRINVKGKKNLLNVYEIKKKIKKPDEKFKGVFIGREKEKKLIKNIINEFLKGKSRIINITGEAGIGKSYLIQKMVSLLPEEKLKVIQTECLPYTKSMPFSVWINVLKGFLNLTDKTTVREFKKSISKYCDDESSALIGELIGFVIKTKYKREFIGEKRKIKIIQAILNILLNFSKKEIPLVLVLEDLHWIDELSLEMLEEFARYFPVNNILLILTARPMGIVLPKNKKTIYLNLNSFTLKETGKLLEIWLPRKKIETKIVEEIFRKTGGNPFFLSELVSTLKNSDLSSDDFNVPEKVEQLLVTKIDHLPIETKNLLKIASVIGSTFDINLLKELLIHIRFKKIEIITELNNFKRTDLIEYLSRVGLSIYAFRHILIQKTVYNTLNYKLKRHLHKLVACWYENKFRRTPEKYYEILALHFERANLTGRAINYLILAAEKSKAIFANRIALEFYNRTENLCLKNFRRFNRQKKRFLSTLYENRGLLYNLLGKYDAAIVNFNKMNEWATKNNDEVKSAYAYNLIGSCYRQVGSHKKAMEYCLKCLKTGRALNNSKLISSALLSITVIYWYTGNYDKAIAFGEESLKLRRKEGDLQGVLRGLFGISNCYVKIGDINRAYKYFIELYNLSKKLKDKTGLSYAYEGLGYCWHWWGSIGKAISCFEKSLSLRTQIEFYRGIAYSYSDIGEVYFELGLFITAEKYFNKANEFLKNIEDNNLRSDIIRNLGYINLVNNRKKIALEYFKQSYTIAIKTRFYESIIKSVYSLCFYYRIIKNFDKTGYFLKKLLTKLVKNCLQQYFVRGLIIKSQIYKSRKRYKQAEEICKKALSTAYNLNNTFLKIETLKNLIFITGEKRKKIIKKLHKNLKIISKSIPDKKLSMAYLKRHHINEFYA